MHGRIRRVGILTSAVSLAAGVLAGCEDGFDPGIKTSCAMSSEYKATANNTPPITIKGAERNALIQSRANEKGAFTSC